MANKYQDAVAALSPPKQFDAHIFVADSTCPQEVCDFVLSLALIFNDLRDIFLGQQFMETIFPTTTTPSREFGQAGGLNEHLFRILMALIQELLVLIDASKSVQSHPEFQRVVRTLHPQAKKAWQTLVLVEPGGKSKDPIGRLVHFARNKVAFHYDPKAIAIGFRAAFLGASLRSPFISYGPSMAKTRFYFADAAAGQLMRDKADPTIVEDFFSAKLELFMQINHAIREVVTTFVRGRIRRLRKRRPSSDD